MRRKNNVQLILLLLVIGLCLGYAYINSDLKINGTARVDHANWDVHWANIQVKTGSVSGSNVVTAPTISNGTTVTYSVILSIPGDYYEFTVDAVNGGVIDAMIDSMEFKVNGVTATNTPEYLNYSLTYTDGIPLAENHELKANTTETYKIKVEYNPDIELSQIPASNQTLLLSFGTIYRQATSNSTPVRNYVYRSNTNDINTGDNISALGTTYETYQEVVSNTGYNQFLRHRIENDQVVETAIGFVYNSNVYYIIGGGATHITGNLYADDSPYYESNKATLQTAFGSSNCSEHVNGDYKVYTCSVSGVYTDANTVGSVEVVDNLWGCGIFYDGFSRCDVGLGG